MVAAVNASSSKSSDPGCSSAPRLAALIVNYDSWDDVERLAIRLAEARDPSCAATDDWIWIIDNASPRPAPDSVKALDHQRGTRLISRPSNDGFAAGINEGWRAARRAGADWVLALNPDVTPGPDLIAQALDRIRRAEGRVGVIGLGLINPDGTSQPSVGPFPSLPRMVREVFLPRSVRKYWPQRKIKPGPVPWVTGACFLLRVSMLEDVGGLDEDFFLYYEEVALCRSATLKGWIVEFDPSIQVIHHNPLQNRGISPQLLVITRHSKLLYFLKHAKRWEFRILARFIAAQAWLRQCLAPKGGARFRIWRTIRQLALTMSRDERRGQWTFPRGRAVLDLAKATVDGPPNGGRWDSAESSPIPAPKSAAVSRIRDRELRQ